MPIPEEIPVNLMQEREVAEGNTNLFGPQSAEEIAAYDNRPRRDDAFVDMWTDALALDNFGVNVYDYANRKNKYKADPDYNFMDHAEMLTSGVPSAWHDKFEGVASLDEALDLRDSIISEVKTAEKLMDTGVSGVLARMAAGVLDLDMAVPFIGPAKKMSVFAKAARAGLYGAGTAGLTEAGLATFGETNDWSTVPAATLMGLVVGGAIGAVEPKVGLTTQIVDGDPAAKAAEWADPNVNALREFSWDGKSNAAVQPDAVRKAADDLILNAQDPTGIAEIDGLDHVINEYSGARVFIGDEGTLGERAAKFAASLETREALKSGYPKRVRDALAKGPLADDATRLWNSGSPTMRSLAVSLFEFSDALVVNNKSSAMLSEFMFGHTYKVFDQVYNQVASASFKRKGFGHLDFKAKDAYLKDLNMRTMMQANDLNLGKITKLDDDVSDILAGIRDLSEKFRREGAGGWGGARPVPGFEKLDAKAAYFPMPWNPDRLRGVLRSIEKSTGSKTKARAKLSGAIKQAYMAANPDMEEEVANQVALALVRRQLAKGDVEDTNIMALLKDDDSRDLLIQAFKDNGVSEDQAELLMQKIAGSDEDKGRVSYGRRRTNIDLAGEYDGIKMIDLVDPDLQKTMLRYSDTMSKRIALTRHGIDSKRKIVAIKKQAKNEMANLNQADKAELEKFLDYMFEYFEPGTVDKHINPWMRRAKATTNLSLLSKLMITQGAETGAIISATGMGNFIQASKVLREASKGMHKSAIMDDFGFLLGNFSYESGLMRSDFVTDAALDIMTSSSKLARTFDAVLAKGQHFQSMLSGYTKVLESQLKLGAVAASNKIFRNLRDGKSADLTDMFGSMGLDAASITKLQKLVDDGTIAFNADGHVEALNVQKWPMDIREDYGLASLRLARTMTQRALAGESIQWLHDPSWAIFGHLQTFPLTAMRKQFLRNMGRKDGQMLALTTWSMGTATLAAMLSSMTEGTEMTPEYLARRAFSLNNAIGWVAPGLDLFATMTGLEEYSPGGRYAQDVSIPLLSVATRAQGIPEALVGLIPGMEFDASDKRALQVLPVVGSAVFMGRVWDAARTDNEE